MAIVDLPAQPSGAVVARRAVVAALTASYDRVVTSEQKGDTVTAARGGVQGTSLAATILLARFERAEPLASTTLAADAAWAEDALVFNGTMRLSRDVAGVGAAAETLSAPQWAMPAQVPLDTRLVEWTSASGSAVEFFVGSIPASPERMRACWHVRTREIRQVSCTRHLRSDGSLVGSDAIHDIGGAIRTHASDDLSMRPRRVLACLRVDTERGQVVGRESGYEVFRFEPPNLITRWDWIRDLGYTDLPLFDSGRTTLADGAIRYWASNPRGIVEVDVRDGAVRRYRSAGGIAGSVSETVCDR